MTAPITSSVGLVTGFPIASTVSALIAIEQQPVTTLTNQNTTLQNQSTAIQTLEAQLLALESSSHALGQASLYQARTITSGNTSALSATANASATTAVAQGSYQYTPVQVAQTQQWESSSLTSDSTPLGAGTLTFGYGGFVNQPVNVDLLNGGAGISPGSIQITDRSGATATVNLTGVQTVGDVISAINSTAGIHVQAALVGDHLQLTDTSGASSSNLKVQEVSGGTTAASLGLANINTSATQAEGTGLLSLFNNLPTSELNDGAGVRFDSFLPDVQVNLADGTSVNVTLHQQAVAGTSAQATTIAANGVDAAIQFTAKQPGPAAGGVTISFVNDPTVTAGHETASYNATAKTLTFGIQAGVTTANDVIAALNKDPTASTAFSATAATGGNGDGVISLSDAAITTGPQSTATTPGALSPDAALTFTAVSGGSNYDNTQIEFVANPSISEGQETVSYDDSNPNSPTLVFQIAQGQTTANDIIAALKNNPTVSQLFTAANASSSDGTGLVSTADTATTSGGALVDPISADAPTTLGAVLADFNAAAPGKLQAQISSDGKSIQLTDLTSGSNTFSISDINGSQAAQDLGLLAAPAQGGVIQGSELLGGLDTVLLADLNGGAGISGLGTLDITNRNGVPSQVDLSSAATLEDVINKINTSAIGVTASVNSARNGIQLTDTTGATASNLIITDGDSSQTAEKLGLAANTATNSVNSGSLHLQTVSLGTLLSSYNGGGGVEQGTFQLIDTNGQSATINVNSQINTVADLINAINATGLAIQAGINSTGDGIQLTDTAHGSGKLQVIAGNSTTAQDLHLLNPVTTPTIGDQPTQVVNGTTTYSINISSTDNLQNLIANINNLGSGVQASEVNDGSSIYPFRMTLTSGQSGAAGQLQVDFSNAPFTLQQTTAGQDALLIVGTPGAGGFLASSPTDTFSRVLPGATLSVTGTSSAPVSLNVAQDNSSLESALQSFVTAYNTVMSSIASATTYNSATQTQGTLEADPDILQVQSNLQNLVSSALSGVGSITSLAALGISISQSGTMSLDTNQLENQLAKNPQAVQSFFSTANSGLSDKFQFAITQLAGPNNSLLVNQTNALATEIQQNTARIAILNSKIAADQTRLTSEFDNAELVVSELQSNMNALSAIQSFATIGGQIAGSTSLSSGSSSSTSSASNSGNLGNSFS
jgi:flagellar hook-associated protein 2